MSKPRCWGMWAVVRNKYIESIGEFAPIYWTWREANRRKTRGEEVIKVSIIEIIATKKGGRK